VTENDTSATRKIRWPLKEGKREAGRIARESKEKKKKKETARCRKGVRAKEATRHLPVVLGPKDSGERAASHWKMGGEIHNDDATPLEDITSV